LVDGSFSTSKLIIMPAERCSAMWQCSIQRPGLEGSSRISTVDPAGSNTVSFHAGFPTGTPFTSRTRNRCPCRWMGCCIAWKLRRSLSSRTRTGCPRRKFHRESMFSFPVAGSRRIQRTCRPEEAQFIIGMVPLHSMGEK
jgi:hypothetical protein